MQFNTDLKAEVAIIGHAIFAGGAITQYLRPDIDNLAATFADWRSGAALFTRRTAQRKRQVEAVLLYKFAAKSDQQRVAELLMRDFASNPTTEAISRMDGVSMSTVTFDSHSLPVPLNGRVAETIYSQLYHQYHDGSVS